MHVKKFCKTKKSFCLPPQLRGTDRKEFTPCGALSFDTKPLVRQGWVNRIANKKSHTNVVSLCKNLLSVSIPLDNESMS